MKGTWQYSNRPPERQGMVEVARRDYNHPHFGRGAVFLGEQSRMSNEEFEKKRDFILDQQAQFSVDIQRLREAQTQTEQVIAQTGEIVTRLANVTLVGFKEVNVKINALVDSQIRTDEKISALADSTDGKINALLSSQIHTDEKFKALADSTDGKINALLSSQMHTDEKFKALADSQMRTDEKIGTLVDSQLRSDRRINALEDSQIRTDDDLRN